MSKYCKKGAYICRPKKEQYISEKGSSLARKASSAQRTEDRIEKVGLTREEFDAARRLEEEADRAEIIRLRRLSEENEREVRNYKRKLDHAAQAKHTA